jgi:hypothetical protein
MAMRLTVANGAAAFWPLSDATPHKSWLSAGMKEAVLSRDTQDGKLLDRRHQSAVFQGAGRARRSAREVRRRPGIIEPVARATSASAAGPCDAGDLQGGPSKLLRHHLLREGRKRR